MISKQLVKERTAARRAPEKHLTPKAIRALNLCKTFGCHTQKVTALVSFLIGESLPVPTSDDDYGFSPFVAVVPLSEDTHGYPVGTAAIIIDSTDSDDYDRAFLPGWKIGGHLPDFNDDNSIRYATDEEIDAFFAATELPKV